MVYQKRKPLRRCSPFVSKPSRTPLACNSIIMRVAGDAFQRLPAITRSIHVDIRYILWLLDGVAGADHIIKEMGLTPQIAITQ